MQDYFDIPKWHTFIWNANTLLKIQTMSFFYTNVSYISFQTFGM
jgi:hypothetical protein